MSSKMKSPLALGAALVGGLVLTGSAFAMQPVSTGTMVSASAAAEGSCGAEYKAKKAADMKAAEGTCGVAKMDTDKDGKVSSAEFGAAHGGDTSKFASHDTNADGFITADEVKAHHEGKCGEGKCGGGACDTAKDKKGKEGKCGEGKCGKH